MSFNINIIKNIYIPCNYNTVDDVHMKLWSLTKVNFKISNVICELKEIKAYS